MTPSSRSSRRNQRDRLSINVVPDHLNDAEPQSPYLHWLFGDTSELNIFSRLVDDDELEEVETGTKYRNVDAVIMKEVAAWLELREHDEFWASRRHNASKDLPTISQVLARLKESDSELRCTPNGTEAFDILVQAIALQLLASCHTNLPTSSASHLPLLHQRISSRPVTALRAHAPYRFTPAAGHHARAPSETSAWPGLYPGPEPGERLADFVSRGRRSAKWSKEYIPSFATSGWTDGGQDIHQHRHPPLTQPTTLSLLQKLTCQPPKSRLTHRRRKVQVSKLLCNSQVDDSSSDRYSNKKSIMRVRTFTVHRFPTLLRPRHTVSTLCLKDTTSLSHRKSRRRFKLGSPSSLISSTGNNLKPIVKRLALRHMSATPNPGRTQSTPCKSDIGSGGLPPARRWLSYTPTDHSPLQRPIVPPPQTSHSPTNPPPRTKSSLPTPTTLAQNTDDYFTSMRLPSLTYDVSTPRAAETRQRSFPVAFGGEDEAARSTGKSELVPAMGRKTNVSEETNSTGSVEWDRRRRGIEAETDALEHGLRGFKPAVSDTRDVGVWPQRHWGSSTFGAGVEGMRGNV